MRECDRRTIEDRGVPGLILMERAGRGISPRSAARFADLNRRRIWIVCGRGNNGGDGLVLARLLHDGGLNPRVLLTDPRGGDRRGRGPSDRRRLRTRGIPLEPITQEIRTAELERLGAEDLLVDAILGTGFKGPWRRRKSRDRRRDQPDARARVVAVDIPSGLSADTGSARRGRPSGPT